MDPNTNQPPTDPNFTPQTPPTLQTPSPSPAPSSVPSTQPTFSTMNPVPTSYQPTPTTSSSSTGLIIAIVGIVLALVIGLVLAWVMFLSPAAKAEKASKSFMLAITSGDTQKMFEFADAGDESSKQFLEASVKSVKGSFTLKDKTMKAGKGYFLYDLSNDTGKSARTIVEKMNGKWVVGDFVFGQDNLALIPNAVKEAPTAKNEVATSGACLVQSDFDEWYKGYGGKTATEQGFYFNDPNKAYTTNVHFPPDSLEYIDKVQAVLLGDFVKLPKDPKVVNKQFMIRLKGSVGTSQADADFANKRSEKVKADLIALGVPVDKIMIDAPGSVTDYGNSSPSTIDKEVFRAVVIKFDPSCDAPAVGSGR